METPATTVSPAEVLKSAEQPVEQKPAEVKTEAPKTEDPKLAALIKKEREAFRLAKLAKEKEASILKDRAEIEKRKQELDELDGLFSKNPLEALKRKGITYQDLTNMVLNGEKVTPEIQVKSIEEQMKTWMKQQEEAAKLKEQQETERLTKEHELTIQNFKEEVKEFVSTRSDEYEFINLYDQQELIYATIEEHFNNTQKVMSIKESADLVEKYLLDQANKALKTKKLASMLKPQAEEKKDAPREPSKTLNNTMTSSVPSMLPAKTENDRLKRALAALDKPA